MSTLVQFKADKLIETHQTLAKVIVENPTIGDFKMNGRVCKRTTTLVALSRSLIPTSLGRTIASMDGHKLIYIEFMD